MAERKCPVEDCGIVLPTDEQFLEHIKTYHRDLYNEWESERLEKLRDRARKRAQTITDTAKWIARELKLDVFSGNSIYNRLMAMEVDPQVIDWVAISEPDWRARYDKDEYQTLLEGKIKEMYGIDLRPKQAAALKDLESEEEFFEEEQLVRILREFLWEDIVDEERQGYLMGSIEKLKKMALEGIRDASYFLINFTEVPIDQIIIRPEEKPKAEKIRSKLSSIDEDKLIDLAKRMSKSELERAIRRKYVSKPVRHIFARELEWRREHPRETVVELEEQRRIGLIEAMLAKMTLEGLNQIRKSGRVDGEEFPDELRFELDEYIHQRKVEKEAEKLKVPEMPKAPKIPKRFEATPMGRFEEDRTFAPLRPPIRERNLITQMDFKTGEPYLIDSDLIWRIQTYNLLGYPKEFYEKTEAQQISVYGQTTWTALAQHLYRSHLLNSKGYTTEHDCRQAGLDDIDIDAIKRIIRESDMMLPPERLKYPPEATKALQEWLKGEGAGI